MEGKLSSADRAEVSKVLESIYSPLETLMERRALTHFASYLPIRVMRSPSVFVSTHLTTHCHYLCAVLDVQFQLRRYSDLESQHLRTELASADLPSTSGEGTADALQQLVLLAFQLCMAVVDRCMRLTLGTELQAVVPVIDTALRDFLTRLKVRALTLHVNFRQTKPCTRF